MIPNYIKPFLWSYNPRKINLKEDKRTIILNILNLGTKKATDWLFKNYSKKEIKQTISRTYKGEWNDKSINLWSMVLNVKPKNKRNVTLRNIR